MIRVLIVDDSAVIREHLRHILVSAPDIAVAAFAVNGEEGVRLAHLARPDVITMDINLPAMNGIEATRRIMETAPAPIVVVSSKWNPHEMAMTFEAMEAGAVAVLETPVGIGHPRFEESSAQLVETIRQMAGVTVVKRRFRGWNERLFATTVPKIAAATNIELVAIGASIGGPPALHSMLMRLEKDFRLPVVICQHIADGFLQGLVDWLTQTTGFPVHIAEHGEFLLPGCGYIAPDAFQMGVDADHRVTLSDSGSVNGIRPSVSYLLRAVGQTFGSHAVGVLLSGMGTDGAEELKLMREAGAVTIAQDEESCVVNGMPGEAIKLGGAMYVLEPAAIAEMLNALAWAHS